MTRSGMISGAQHHLARKVIIIRAVDLFLCYQCIETWQSSLANSYFRSWSQIKREKGKWKFVALFLQQFCWLLWDSVNTVSGKIVTKQNQCLARMKVERRRNTDQDELEVQQWVDYKKRGKFKVGHSGGLQASRHSAFWTSSFSDFSFLALWANGIHTFRGWEIGMRNIAKNSQVA